MRLHIKSELHMYKGIYYNCLCALEHINGEIFVIIFYMHCSCICMNLHKTFINGYTIMYFYEANVCILGVVFIFLCSSCLIAKSLLASHASVQLIPDVIHICKIISLQKKTIQNELHQALER